MCVCVCFCQFAIENEDLSQHLSAAKDAQRQLTTEALYFKHNKSVFHVFNLTKANVNVIDYCWFLTHTQLQELEEKYSECIEMLHEAQEELKNLRNRSVSAGTPRRYHPLGLFPMVHKQTCSYITHARPVL